MAYLQPMGAVTIFSVGGFSRNGGVTGGACLVPEEASEALVKVWQCILQSQNVRLTGVTNCHLIRFIIVQPVLRVITLMPFCKLHEHSNVVIHNNSQSLCADIMMEGPANVQKRGWWDIHTDSS